MHKWRSPKERPPLKNKLLLLIKDNQSNSDYVIVTARYDYCEDSNHSEFYDMKMDFETECGCKCICDGGEYIPADLILGWMELSSLKPVDYPKD